MKKILIFGVTGNSGRELARYYLKKGWVVYGVGRKDNLHEIEDVLYIKGDITDLSLYDNLPSEVDVVVNFAGVQPSIMENSESTNLYATLREYIEININGVYNILEWVSKSKIRSYIYSTTHRDYEGYWKSGIVLENNMPTSINYKGDHAMYAISKVTGQMIGDYLLPLKSVRCFNLRLPMMFQVPESPYYLVNGERRIMPFLKIIKDAIEGKILEIWGNPNMKRDYVYVDNLVKLIDGCVESSISGGTFSVGTGEGATTEYFIKTIAEVFGQGSNHKIIYKPEQYTYKSAVYNVDEQKRLLGYNPILLREMLEKIKYKLFNEGYLEDWKWKK